MITDLIRQMSNKIQFKNSKNEAVNKWIATWKLVQLLVALSKNRFVSKKNSNLQKFNLILELRLQIAQVLQIAHKFQQKNDIKITWLKQIWIKTQPLDWCCIFHLSVSCVIHCTYMQSRRWMNKNELSESLNRFEYSPFI